MKVVIRKLDKESREKPDWDYMIVGVKYLSVGVDSNGKTVYAYQQFGTGDLNECIHFCKEEGWEYEVVEAPAHETRH